MKNYIITFYAGDNPIAEISVKDVQADMQQTRTHYQKFAQLFINPRINGSQIREEESHESV